jgi:hypothetical protein
MLNEHERDSGVVGQILQQLGEGLQPPGRCTDSGYRIAAGSR